MTHEIDPPTRAECEAADFEAAMWQQDIRCPVCSSRNLEHTDPPPGAILDDRGAVFGCLECGGSPDWGVCFLVRAEITQRSETDETPAWDHEIDDVWMCRTRADDSREYVPLISTTALETVYRWEKEVGDTPRDAVLAHAVRCREALGRGEDTPVYTGPSLVGTILHYADLRGANLRGADLRGAELLAARLCGADLRNANLRGAALQRVDLYDANLRDADLRGAGLYRAKLHGANLSWSSHDLFSEILWRAADTEPREMLAAYVLRKRHWCWEEWEEYDHPERDWALAELAKWVREGDNAPDIVRNFQEETE